MAFVQQFEIQADMGGETTFAAPDEDRREACRPVRCPRVDVERIEQDQQSAEENGHADKLAQVDGRPHEVRPVVKSYPQYRPRRGYPEPRVKWGALTGWEVRGEDGSIARCRNGVKYTTQAAWLSLLVTIA